MSPWKDPGSRSQWRRGNRDRINERTRQRRAATPEPHRASSKKWGHANRGYRNQKAAEGRHGPDAASVTAALWEKQRGQCYLCGIYLVPDAGSAVVLDHDHRCCPAQKSCRYCRRGLACDYCNTLIGLANDDPALLRQIADNLEAARADVDSRLADKPVQFQLHFTDGAR